MYLDVYSLAKFLYQLGFEPRFENVEEGAIPILQTLLESPELILISQLGERKYLGVRGSHVYLLIELPRIGRRRFYSVTSIDVPKRWYSILAGDMATALLAGLGYLRLGRARVGIPVIYREPTFYGSPVALTNLVFLAPYYPAPYKVMISAMPSTGNYPSMLLQQLLNIWNRLAEQTEIVPRLGIGLRLGSKKVRETVLERFGTLPPYYMLETTVTSYPTLWILPEELNIAIQIPYEELLNPKEKILTYIYTFRRPLPEVGEMLEKEIAEKGEYTIVPLGELVSTVTRRELSIEDILRLILRK